MLFRAMAPGFVIDGNGLCARCINLTNSTSLSISLTHTPSLPRSCLVEMCRQGECEVDSFKNDGFIFNILHTNAASPRRVERSCGGQASQESQVGRCIRVSPPCGLGSGPSLSGLGLAQVVGSCLRSKVCLRSEVAGPRGRVVS